uniref:Uncharacterized protein n=1 Tax=Tetranychus urticae TaxID=32264 RepID=T1KCC6_TETUR
MRMLTPDDLGHFTVKKALAPRASIQIHQQIID